MRHVTLALSLILAIQPALIVAMGRPCGDAECGLTTACEADCGGCSSADGDCCCTPDRGGEPVPSPAPIPTETETRALVAVVAAAPPIALAVVPRSDPAPPVADAPAPEETHNARLALRCISRT